MHCEVSGCGDLLDEGRGQLPRRPRAPTWPTCPRTRSRAAGRGARPRRRRRQPRASTRSCRPTRTRRSTCTSCHRGHRRRGQLLRDQEAVRPRAHHRLRAHRRAGRSASSPTSPSGRAGCSSSTRPTRRRASSGCATPSTSRCCSWPTCPGFMIGKKVERQGIIRHGAKMISAVSDATVPKICVVVRKAYGAGLYAMCGPAFDADATLALPQAMIAVMGPEAAVNAVFSNKIEEKPEAERAAYVEQLRERVPRGHRHLQAGRQPARRRGRARRRPARRARPAPDRAGHQDRHGLPAPARGRPGVAMPTAALTCISAAEARRRLAGWVQPPGIESVALDDAGGRVLAREIRAADAGAGISPSGHGRLRGPGRRRRQRRPGRAGGPPAGGPGGHGGGAASVRWNRARPSPSRPAGICPPEPTRSSCWRTRPPTRTAGAGAQGGRTRAGHVVAVGEEFQAGSVAVGLGRRIGVPGDGRAGGVRRRPGIGVRAAARGDRLDRCGAGCPGPDAPEGKVRDVNQPAAGGRRRGPGRDGHAGRPVPEDPQALAPGDRPPAARITTCSWSRAAPRSVPATSPPRPMQRLGAELLFHGLEVRAGPADAGCALGGQAHLRAARRARRRADHLPGVRRAGALARCRARRSPAAGPRRSARLEAAYTLTPRSRGLPACQLFDIRDGRRPGPASSRARPRSSSLARSRRAVRSSRPGCGGACPAGAAVEVSRCRGRTRFEPPPPVPHCPRCRRKWSASTSAIIASTIGTARGSTQGSWRPRALRVVLVAVDVDGLLLAQDGRGRLERHADDDVLAVGDAALDAARAVGARADAPVRALKNGSLCWEPRRRCRRSRCRSRSPCRRAATASPWPGRPPACRTPARPGRRARRAPPPRPRRPASRRPSARRR